MTLCTWGHDTIKLCNKLFKYKQEIFIILSLPKGVKLLRLVQIVHFCFCAQVVWDLAVWFPSLGQDIFVESVVGPQLIVCFLQVLRLHIDDSETKKEDPRSSDLTEVSRSRVTSLQVGILGATVALAGIGIMVYLKRSRMWLDWSLKEAPS